MNIFEQLDALLKSTNKLNESVKYEDLPIEPTMETAEQAKEYIRKYFIKVLETEDEGGGSGGGEGFAPIEPPPPPFSREKGDKSDEGGDADRSWTDKDLEWDDDDFLKALEIEAEEEDLKLGEDGEEGDEYDDFTDKTSKKPGGGSGEGDGEGGDGDGDKPEDDDETSRGSGRGSDEKEDTDDDDDASGEGGEGDGSSKKGDGKKDDETSADGDSGDGDGDSADGKTSKGDKSSKGGKSSKGEGDEMEGDDMDMEGASGEGSEGEKKDGETSKDGKGSGEGDGEKGDDESSKDGEGSGEGDDEKGDDEDGSGNDGESGNSSKDLKDSIDELLSELADKYESDKERLKEIKELADDENASEEDIDDKMDFDKAEARERERKLKSLAGTLEKAPTKEEMDRELEAADKLSKEEIEEMKKDLSDIMKEADVPSDEEYDRLRKEAMEELNKKCKGHSRLASSILYHSLRTPELDKSDWDKVIEKVLKKKSKNSTDKLSTSKTKKVVVGDKKHMWRDVRLGYKTIKRGDDKQSIYCFIDYSGTVRSESGLIVTFLGKILEMTGKLKYTDLHLYTFADSLSVPRVINEEMMSKDGYETVLADTINFFELPENYVGGSIEDFSIVGYEINKIKKNDRDAIIFIFGDGIWTFYGNWNPPTKLNEVCPNWIKDIIAFVFYKDENFLKNYLGKEISLLKDVVGIQDVIVTKASDMKE